MAIGILINSRRGIAYLYIHTYSPGGLLTIVPARLPSLDHRGRNANNKKWRCCVLNIETKKKFSSSPLVLRAVDVFIDFALAAGCIKTLPRETLYSLSLSLVGQTHKCI